MNEQKLMSLMRLRARFMYWMKPYYRLTLKRMVDGKEACPLWLKPLEKLHGFCQRLITKRAKKLRANIAATTNA